MQVGKPKAIFRLKFTDVRTNKSKNLTIYEGEDQKTLDQFYQEIVNHLRAK